MATIKVDKSKIFKILDDELIGVKWEKTGSPIGESILVSSGFNIRHFTAFLLFLLYISFLFLLLLNFNDIKNPKELKINEKTGIAITEKYSPTFFSLYDISQANYKIAPFSTELVDTICIDLGTLAEFSMFTIEPDYKNQTAIFFYDQNKIQEFGLKGFKFYARYPEFQNKQDIRFFIVTLLLTLLLQKIIKIICEILVSLVGESNKTSNNEPNNRKYIPS